MLPLRNPASQAAPYDGDLHCSMGVREVRKPTEHVDLS